MASIDYAWIDANFPGLAESGYEVTSEATNQYNCIAWAAGDTTTLLIHLPGYRWPADRGPSIGHLVGVFVGLGYEACETGDAEPLYDKVALYEDGGRWSHAARQVDDGQWTSKLGWEGGWAPSFLERLKMDVMLKYPIMENEDVVIRPHLVQNCWTISVSTETQPKRELWDCYQQIGGHLRLPVDITMQHNASDKPPF